MELITLGHRAKAITYFDAVLVVMDHPINGMITLSIEVYGACLDKD
jgi:hypothetical protein